MTRRWTIGVPAVLDATAPSGGWWARLEDDGAWCTFELLETFRADDQVGSIRATTTVYEVTDALRGRTIEAAVVWAADGASATLLIDGEAEAQLQVPAEA